MHLSHIPQYTIQNRAVSISVLNAVLWDMGQVHWGVCEFGLPCTAGCYTIGYPFITQISWTFACTKLISHLSSRFKIMHNPRQRVRDAQCKMVKLLGKWHDLRPYTHRQGDKSLSGPMVISLLTHICVTQPQWVKRDYGVNSTHI